MSSEPSVLLVSWAEVTGEPGVKTSTGRRVSDIVACFCLTNGCKLGDESELDNSGKGMGFFLLLIFDSRYMSSPAYLSGGRSRGITSAKVELSVCLSDDIGEAAAWGHPKM